MQGTARSFAPTRGPGATGSAQVRPRRPGRTSRRSGVRRGARCPEPRQPPRRVGAFARPPFRTERRRDGRCQSSKGCSLLSGRLAGMRRICLSWKRGYSTGRRSPDWVLSPHLRKLPRPRWTRSPNGSKASCAERAKWFSMVRRVLVRRTVRSPSPRTLRRDAHLEEFRRSYRSGAREDRGHRRFGSSLHLFQQ